MAFGIQYGHFKYQVLFFGQTSASLSYVLGLYQ